MRRFGALTDGNPASRVGKIHAAFGLEVAMSEALEASCKELADDIGQPGVAREVIAR
jgi:hypothetical protein